MTRVLFHVQHLLGIGHIKRAAAIARAAARAGHEVTVAAGGAPVPGIDFGDARIVQLPPATAADATFKVLLDEAGRPIDDAWRERRRRRLLELFEATRPDVVLIELFPFGRRPFRFEFLPLLDAATARVPRPAVACSVRDILVAKSKPGRNEEIVETVRTRFDAVLVHGDPRIVPFETTFPLATEIADHIRYTGYVCDAGGPEAPPGDGDGEVVVSVGGGSVGEPLVRAAMAARPLSAARDRTWRILAGPNLPGGIEALRAAAPEGVVVEPNRPDFRSLLSRCAASISQAGYNTVMDLLAARAPAVVVPFAAERESEQATRANVLAERGWLRVVDETGLDPTILAGALDAVLGRKPGTVGDIDLDGAARTASELANLGNTQ